MGLHTAGSLDFSVAVADTCSWKCEGNFKKMTVVWWQWCCWWGWHTVFFQLLLVYKLFTNISFAFHQNPMQWVLLLSPGYKWGTRDLMGNSRLGTKGITGPESHISWPAAYCSFHDTRPRSHWWNVKVGLESVSPTSRTTDHTSVSKCPTEPVQYCPQNKMYLKR